MSIRLSYAAWQAMQRTIGGPEDRQHYDQYLATTLRLRPVAPIGNVAWDADNDVFVGVSVDGEVVTSADGMTWAVDK